MCMPLNDKYMLLDKISVSLYDAKNGRTIRQFWMKRQRDGGISAIPHFQCQLYRTVMFIQLANASLISE